MYPLGKEPNYEPDASDCIAARAEREGVSPYAYDVLVGNGGKNFLFFPLFDFSERTLSPTLERLRHGGTILGLGDGGAHFGIGSGVCVDPRVSKRAAIRAEELGYDSLWTGEHVVYPDPREEPSNADPDFPILHPSTCLAYVAGVTERVLLGTGIMLIAQRNPVVLAMEFASLDVVSQGRLVLGIGVGYEPQEFAALGVNFRDRSARADEYVAAMRALWNDPKPSFDGHFVKFSNVQARPRPVQPGGPPIESMAPYAAS